MSSVRTWVASAIALSNILSPVAFAKGSIQATQLDIVPVDSSVRCNRVFFKSTDQHKGTVFMMPRVVPGTGELSGRLYDLARSDKPGRYILTLNLYFPENDSALMSRNATDSRKDRDACNLDSVKLAINRGVPAQDQISRIAPAPLTSVELKIKGIQRIGRIGRTIEDTEDKEKEVDVLDYYGKIRTAQFEISEAEMNYFNASIVSGDGLPATVKFSFQVRALDGSVTATLNIEELKKRLTAAANGAAYMVKADVSAALSSALDRRSISITSQAGSEEANKMMQEMVTKVMSEFSLAIDNKVAEEAAAGKPEAAEGKISVTAALELLSNEVERSLTWRGYSAPEKAIHETEIRLRTNSLNDYNVIPVKVSAGYRDDSLGVDLSPGRTIGISGNGWALFKYNFKAKTSYMTTSQISYWEVGNKLSPGEVSNPTVSTLTDSALTLEDVSRNGVDYAVGKKKVLGWFNSMAEYRWVLLVQEAEAIRIESARAKNMATDIKGMPVGVSFTGLNERKVFMLEDLLKPSKHWDAWIDENDVLRIRAKSYLGDVIFRNAMTGAKDVEYGAPMDTVKAYMVYIDPLSKVLGENVYPTVTVGRDNNPITKQRVYYFSVQRPEAYEGAYHANSKTINDEGAANFPSGRSDDTKSLRGVMPGPSVPSTDQPQP